ncbi:hypothetical protein LFL96_32845 [Paraburkholderia sp. D15]|uniref:hypothetical protein n=1 Tax=Paraburkholderia sp. D15 TaxID=2880218 RepID=UPI00247A10B5|nr:hypothetical protein [Paraburkholderia sp. D15]WGS52960.1 hypothetical protein LFL96_32845 [Paraburkholderia sp. D15]
MTTIPEAITIKRPVSLTIVGWLLIVLDAANLIFVPLMLSNPITLAVLSEYRVPPGVTILIGLIVSVLCIVAGIAVLKGRQWGRTLYVGATLAGYIISLATMPSHSLVPLLPSFLVFVLFAFLLFRRPATAYFRRAKA